MLHATPSFTTRVVPFAAIVLALLACESETTTPLDRVVAISIVVDPPTDTVELADTATLTIQTDSLIPTNVAWTVGPDTVVVVGDTLRYTPPGAGTTCIRAIAEFAADRVGSDARCFFTPTNSAPSVTIALPPGEEFSLVADFNFVALGDTIVLIAVIDDPDGDVIDAAHIRWFLNEAGDTVLAGTGDTLRLPVTEVREYDIEVAVVD